MITIKMKQEQQGAVLVVSLLVLLVMTMIGLAAVRTTVLEEKMAGNMHDKNLAFQAAEAGLRAGENAIRDDFSDAQLTACTAGNDVAVSTIYTVVCHTLAGEPDPFVDTTWTAAGNYSNVATDNYAVVDNQTAPKFYITFIDQRDAGLVSMGIGKGSGKTSPKTNYFRITARGTGGSDDAQSVLRSYFAR